MNRLAGISYKQLAELAERYPDENQGMSLVIVFMVPDESAKKKALSLCHFLDRQGIKAGLFFAGHQSVLSNRVEALARIRAADSFVIWRSRGFLLMRPGAWKSRGLLSMKEP